MFSFMTLLDSTIVNISLPAISSSLDISLSLAALINIAYLLTLTSSLVAFGKLGDRIGLKKIFIAGFILFTSGSLLCGLSPSLTLLVASRAVQGLGGAMAYVIAPALIPKYLPMNVRGKGFAMLLTTATLGLLLGAPLGGLITTYASWHWIFLINVPFGIAASILSYMFVPRDEPDAEARSKPFDVIGALLCFFFIGFFCFAANQGEEIGWTSPIILSLVAGIVVLFALFISRQHKIEYPLIDLKFFKDLDFSLANLANMFSFAAFAGNNFLLPFFLIRIKGLSSESAGYTLLIFSIVFLVVNYFIGRIMDRLSLRKLCIAGFSIEVFAYFIFTMTLGYSGIWPVAVFLAMNGFAMAIFSAPINELVMNMTHETDQGIVSGIFKTGTNLGLIFGVCLFELVFEQVLVRGSGLSGKNILDVAIPIGMLDSGFRFAYISGLLVNVLALVFSIISREKVA
jgi:EmrB/QacA subfamily drug resistance transporter